jgi:hypothetical protein
VRYFLFIPWMYLRLERKRVPSAEVAERARQEEIKLIDALLASGDSDGTIGRLARRRLKRLPTHVYWQGLQRWGIRLYPGSQDQYHRSLDRFYQGRDHAPRTDDGEPVPGGRMRNWHAGLPDAPADFPRAASMSLTREEADYLRERIVQRAPGSLLAFMVDHDIPPEDVAFPWEHPRLADFPAANREELLHARNFSELMHGAQLLYNLILAEMRKWDEPEQDFSERMGEWTELTGARRGEYERWDRKRFWATAQRGNLRVLVPTRTFVERWLTLAIESAGTDITRSDTARTLVRERERQLKRGQARVNGGRPLELWGGDSGSRQLDYRWAGTVRRFLADIQDGRARGPGDA